MNDLTKLFFLLFRIGLDNDFLLDDSCKELLTLPLKQWCSLLNMAERHGSGAIAFDGVNGLYNTYGKEVKAARESPTEWTQWVFECAGRMSLYEQRSSLQKSVIAELVNIWASEEIKMMIFKGQANASFYPIPDHRASGDIDCWLFGDAEKGDDIMARHGAVIDFKWYRHSKISFRGEIIENHRVFAHTRGHKRNKVMEDEMRTMLTSSDLHTIEGCGDALMPSAQFNACFLTYHGLHHFVSEGLRVKQILDWAVFLQKEQDKVDWNLFNDFCEQYKLDRFAEVMNFIASEYLGVQLKSSDIKVDGSYADKIIQSTLYDDDYLFNSGKGDWAVRWLLVKNMLTRDKWKYRDIAQQNVLKQLWCSSMGALFNRDDEGDS